MTDAAPGPQVLGSRRRRNLCAALLACVIAAALPALPALAQNADPCLAAEAIVDVLTPLDLAGDESGLGGTSVYGTIRALGSICVNGLRVHFEDRVGVIRNGVQADLSDLAVGQVVWLRVRLQGGRHSTNRIAVYSAVVGRVSTSSLQNLLGTFLEAADSMEASMVSSVPEPDPGPEPAPDDDLTDCGSPHVTYDEYDEYSNTPLCRWQMIS